MDRFGLLLILMKLAMIEGTFRKATGPFDRGEFFFVGLVGLFLKVELVETGQDP